MKRVLITAVVALTMLAGPAMAQGTHHGHHHHHHHHKHK